ncbi:MAG: tRNA (N6-threonylcarbamoyladenosine(37)-N6)-methyltransferase TrmO [Bacteroidetes bacterium 4484_249]|nr:MAG: tRNA (N6-threonylcarbamoyladenosine(37)-N6)-methyltransferase TrmO [Bacteroidetes bacterium 4484_249]
MNKIIFKPIGVIQSPFSEPKGTPIQPSAAENIEGSVKVFPEFAGGLKDIEGFSHIILIYYFHLSKKSSLLVTPFMDLHQHGVFATRAPARPNPIGFSVVKLEKVEENTLLVKDIDIIDGTPLLDIKPCVPEFDFSKVAKTGWLESNVQNLTNKKDDGRFVE